MTALGAVAALLPNPKSPVAWAAALMGIANAVGAKNRSENLVDAIAAAAADSSAAAAPAPATRKRRTAKAGS